VKRALVIQCGARKAPLPLKVRDLYLKGLWETYRARRREHGGPFPVAVYVLSAEHGLVHEEELMAPYDTRLTRADLDDFAYELRGAIPFSKVYYVGSRLYLEALELAGYDVIDLESRGIGYKRQALSEFLRSL